MLSSSPESNAALKKKGSKLIDDAGSSLNEAISDTMNRLQIELIGSLDGYEPHCRTLNSFGDCLSVDVIVLLRFHKRSYELCRDKPQIMAIRNCFSRDMVSAAARLHANETRRSVRQKSEKLGPGKLLSC